MRELLRNPYFVVTLYEEEELIRLTRTEEPFSSLEEVASRWLEVCAVFDRAGRKGRALLSDLRRAPARNDPEFEKTVRSILPHIHRQFRRNAVLVRLAVGGLQIRRHAREDGIERLVTDSEEEAWAYCREGAPSSSSRR